MKTQALLQTIENGTFSQSLIVPKEIQPYEIMCISNMQLLLEIARRHKEFEFLSDTDTWENNSERQLILGSMDRLNAFLRDVAKSGCGCEKYKYVSCSPDEEQKKGLIVISREEQKGYEIQFECRCTNCDAMFSVLSYEERFGHDHLWRRKI